MNWFADLLNGERDFNVVTPGDNPLAAAILTPLLETIILGDGVPGIELVGLDVDNASFEVGLFGAVDTFVVDGINEIIGDLESDDFDVTNDESEFAIINVGDGESIDVGTGLTVDSDNLAEILGEVLDGDRPAVEITGIDQDNVTVAITVPGNAADTLIIDGAEAAITEVANEFVDLGNDHDELGVFSADSDDFIVIGDAGSVSDEFEDIADSGSVPGLPGIIPQEALLSEDEILALVEELVLGDGVDHVELLNIDNDTATVEVTGDSTDIIVFDNLDLSTLSDMYMA